MDGLLLLAWAAGGQGEKRALEASHHEVDAACCVQRQVGAPSRHKRPKRQSTPHEEDQQGWLGSELSLHAVEELSLCSLSVWKQPSEQELASDADSPPSSPDQESYLDAPESEAHSLQPDFSFPVLPVLHTQHTVVGRGAGWL